MPKFDVKSPDGRVYRVNMPEGYSGADAVNYVKALLTEPAPPEELPEMPPEHAGFWNALKESAYTLPRYGKEAKEFAEQPESEEKRQALIKAGESKYYSPEFGEGENWEAFKSLLGSSVGQWVAPAIAATAGAVTPIPGAALASGIATRGAQYSAQGALRTAQEQQAAIDAGVTAPEFDLTKNLLAAAGSTALDELQIATFSKLFRALPFAKNMVLKESAAPSMVVEAARSGKGSFVGGVFKGAVKGTAFEVPQEMAQTALERWQAGLSLNDDDAVDEYKQAALGAAILGPLMGGVEGALPSRRTAARAAPPTPPSPPAGEAAEVTPSPAITPPAGEAAEVTPSPAITPPAGEAAEAAEATEAAEVTPSPAITPQSNVPPPILEQARQFVAGRKFVSPQDLTTAIPDLNKAKAYDVLDALQDEGILGPRQTKGVYAGGHDVISKPAARPAAVALPPSVQAGMELANVVNQQAEAQKQAQEQIEQSKEIPLELPPPVSSTGGVLSGWDAANYLANAAEREGINLAELPRQDYAEYAINNGVVLSPEQLRAAPQARMAKSAREVLDIAQQLRTDSEPYEQQAAEFSKVMESVPTRGAKIAGVGNNIQASRNNLNNTTSYGFRINGGFGVKGAAVDKGFLGFRNPAASMSGPRILGFMNTLAERGYKGEIQTIRDPINQSNTGDQIVFRGATKEDVQLANEVAGQIFGNEIAFRDVAPDTKWLAGEVQRRALPVFKQRLRQNQLKEGTSGRGTVDQQRYQGAPAGQPDATRLGASDEMLAQREAAAPAGQKAQEPKGQGLGGDRSVVGEPAAGAGRVRVTLTPQERAADNKAVLDAFNASNGKISRQDLRRITGINNDARLDAARNRLKKAGKPVPLTTPRMTPEERQERREDRAAAERTLKDTTELASKATTQTAFTETKPEPARFQRGEPGRGMLREKVSSIIGGLTAGWENAPTINVIQSVTDAPAEAGKIFDNAKGFVHDGQIYIVAENATDESGVRATLFHEALGHAGLRAAFGQELRSLLLDIYNNNTGFRKATDAWLARNPDTYAGLSKEDQAVSAMEELFAEHAEAGPQQKNIWVSQALQRVTALVRKFLRDLGIIRNYSMNDIMQIIEQSHDAIISGGATPAMQGATRFQRGESSILNPDIRYQRDQQNGNVNNIGRVTNNLPVPNDSLLEGIKNALSKIPDALRRAYLGFLSLPQIAELYGKKGQIPSLHDLVKLLEERAASLAKRAEPINENIRKWAEIAKVHAEELPRFYDIAMRTTIDQVDVFDPAMANNSLTREFNSLPAPLKQVYKELIESYKKQSDELLDRILDNVSAGDVAAIRREYESRRLKVYLPLFRQGNYWLTYQDSNNDTVTRAFGSPRERQMAIDALEGTGARDIEVYGRLNQISRKEKPPTGFAGDVIKKLRANNAPPEMVDSVYATLLDYMPAESLRQMFRKNENRGVLGFEPDVFQVYANVAKRMANQLNNLQFGKPMDTVMSDIRTEAGGERAPQALRDVVQNITAQTDFLYNPINGDLVNGLSYFSYFWNIAGNISSATVNLTQLPIVVYPMLGGKYGYDKAASALNKAKSMYFQGGRDDSTEFMQDFTFYKDDLDQEYKDLFNFAVGRSAIRRSVGYEVIEARQKKVEDYTGLRAKVEHGLGFLFQNTERFNREVTLLAAYDLAKQNGMTNEQAREEALRLVTEAHGTALVETGPRFFQTGLGKVAFTFKRFAQSQIYLLGKLFAQVYKGESEEVRRVAMRQVLGIYGAAYAFAGVQGMPLYGAGSMLVNMIMAFFDDDEPFDPDETVRSAIGDLGYKGPVNQLFNIDIASRTGFNNLIWRDDPRRMAEVGPALYAMESAFGPAYSTARGMIEGGKLIGDGDYQRGLESITPSFIRNGMKSFRYATDGATNRDGVPIVDDVNGYNTFMQILGFTPADLAEARARAGAMKSAERAIVDRRVALLDRIYAARKEGDIDGLVEALDAANEFSQKHPERGFAITSDTIKRSYTAKQAKERSAVDGVYLDKNLAPYLKEEYGN